MSANNTREAGGEHYRRGKIQPWDLTQNMETSGNAHVDGCRCSIIKYAFRKKGDVHKMIDDLRKAAHYAEEAAQTLERVEAEKGMDELPWKWNKEPGQETVIACERCGRVICDCIIPESYPRIPLE